MSPYPGAGDYDGEDEGDSDYEPDVDTLEELHGSDPDSDFAEALERDYGGDEEDIIVARMQDGVHYPGPDGPGDKDLHVLSLAEAIQLFIDKSESSPTSIARQAGVAPATVLSILSHPDISPQSATVAKLRKVVGYPGRLGPEGEPRSVMQEDGILRVRNYTHSDVEGLQMRRGLAGGSPRITRVGVRVTIPESVLGDLSNSERAEVIAAANLAAIERAALIRERRR